MKKPFYILLITACYSVAVSCNKKLEIAPENTLVDKDVFKSEAGTEQALAAAYYDLFSAVAGTSYLLGDFTTPLLSHSVYYDTWDLGQASPADETTQSLWANYYKAINTANNVLTKIPMFAQYTKDRQDQLIAECKFIRSYCYLDLLKLFGDGALTGKAAGLGVPLQLTPFAGYNTGDVMPRATNDQVYVQIIKDLTDILPVALDNQSSDLKTRSRASKGNIYALLARANLYRQDYAAAAVAAKQTIDKTSLYSLVTTGLRDLFPSNPNGTAQAPAAEYVFVIPVSQIGSSSSVISNGGGNSYYFKYSFWIKPSFISEFEAGDKRKTELIWRGDSIYNSLRFSDFTTFKFNNSNGRDNLSLIRLAEVILTRSEALARTTGVTTEAVGLLNQIRSRSVPTATPFTVSSFANATALIEEILKQRKFELAFEGQYRYDVIRSGKPLHSPDIPEGKKVLPVPQIEIDISNGVIKQNPGYIS